MNLLILLVVIIIIAILFGLLYKYKLGGDERDDLIKRLSEESGWKLCAGTTILCHPDDMELLNVYLRDHGGIKCKYFMYKMFLDDTPIRSIECYFIGKDIYNEFKISIKNKNIIYLLCQYYKVEKQLNPYNIKIDVYNHSIEIQYKMENWERNISSFAIKLNGNIIEYYNRVGCVDGEPGNTTKINSIGELLTYLEISQGTIDNILKIT